MLVSVDELRQFVETDKPDQELEFRILALESFICKHTNNEFIDRNTKEKNYPPDVKLGAINILKWQIQNEERNSGDASKQAVQSETISRHSVTYAADSTESDIDATIGVPRKLCAFLKLYERARF